MVCARDGQVVARCSNGPRRDGELAGLEGEIHGLYAHPNAWGIGAGSLLLADALCDLDRRFEATVVWVLSQSPRAHACYARAGFTVVADGVEHRQHPEAPLALMRRQRRLVG
jgi:GNAT superfamily N-acetyltransferase